MKRFLFVIMMLVSMLIQAREVRSLKDLRTGDTFSMRMILPMKGAKLKSPWLFEQIQKIDVDFHVLSTQKDSVHLAVKPTHWFVCNQSSHNKNVNVYLDSDYNIFYDYNPMFYLFDNNSVTASINANDGGVRLNFKFSQEERDANRSRRKWYTQLPEIPKGLKMFSFENFLPDLEFDFEQTLNLSLTQFIKDWEKTSDTGLPFLTNVELTPNLKTKQDMSAFLLITGASFGLQPNTRLTLKPEKHILPDRIFLKIGEDRIYPQKQKNGAYEFSFFLASPKRAYFQDVILDLTPDDSINVAYNQSTKDYQFEGKGAASSIFTNAMAKKINSETIFTNLKEVEEYYQSILSANSSGMNSYWLKSAELLYDYLYASEQFRVYNEKTIKNWGKEFPSDDEIPWASKHISNIFPYADYLYQPYTYGRLIDNFFIYKARQANNSVLTGMRYLQEHIPSYYFADAVFWGYPKSYLTSRTLRDLMERFPLTENDREYKDFMSKLHDPEIRKSIVNLHTQLEKVEPGANIKDLGLEVQKYIPLKKNSDDYIILLVGDSLGYNPILKDFEQSVKSIYESMDEEMKKEGLSDRVEICIMMPERARYLLDEFPDMKVKINFISEQEFGDYNDKVLSEKRCFFVLRSDGVILDRRQNASYKSTPYFVIEVIKDDIKNKKNQDSASSGVLVVILSSLLSIVFTFFLVRLVIRRREKTKRHILELELKAIRAQINPHFTFNALGSIQNLILQKKDKEANDYLVNFSKLLRIVLSTSEKKLVPLSDEIELLDVYLRLEQLRVPFEYSKEIAPDIDIENEEIPGMLIQPIVENAVKHGIAPKGGGHIQLNFKKIDQYLHVEVMNTGEGFSDLNIKGHKGFGLRSVNERLNLLHKELGLNISLKVENIERGGLVEGVKVLIVIPI